jgi:hypothetical protein
VGVRPKGYRGDAPRTRGRRLDAALVAAGESSLLTNYDLTRGGLCERLWNYQTLEAGYVEVVGVSWPSDAAELAPVEGAKLLFRQKGDVVYLLADGSYAHVEVGGGWAYAKISGPSYDAVYEHLATFQALYPATYLDATEDRVPVTFWTLGQLGPVRRLRMIDSAPWSAVEENYPSETRDQVAALMGEFAPGKSGQLLLWQGPPGTGKTWALRALASEWLPWAEFHYITDPDSFFVDDPSYMIDVLLSETYPAFSEAGEVFHENAQEGKWRVLILEDTGELLSANAKEKYGQGLSRLLNVVDGMIGQGLRVLCLVTTNDELGELNAAVRRPGRCAAQIVFPAFPATEASAWLGESVDEPMTVAEMYARRGDPADALALEDEQEMAADDESEPADPREEIARVAEEVNPLAVDNGQTAYDADSSTVLWVASDSTSDDDLEQARDAFLAINGVENFVSEAEGAPEGWCGAEVLYGGNPFDCGDEAALQAAIALAVQPLNEHV